MFTDDFQVCVKWECKELNMFLCISWKRWMIIFKNRYALSPNNVLFTVLKCVMTYDSCSSPRNFGVYVLNAFFYKNSNMLKKWKLAHLLYKLYKPWMWAYLTLYRKARLRHTLLSFSAMNIPLFWAILSTAQRILKLLRSPK